VDVAELDEKASAEEIWIVKFSVDVDLVVVSWNERICAVALTSSQKMYCGLVVR
jgi:hypothetical protein